jgi:hypothetical protein
MKRAIKFKLKNGKEVVIRPLKADDYDAFVKFYKEFVNGPSAKMNFEYPGAPVESKEHYVNAWTNKFVLNLMNFYIKNEFPIFAEFLIDNLAKQLDYQNFSEKYKKYKEKHFTGFTYSGYVHWYDLLGINRYNKEKRSNDVLWHMYSNEEDYLNKINEIFKDKYSIENFKNIVNI